MKYIRYTQFDMNAALQVADEVEYYHGFGDGHGIPETLKHFVNLKVLRIQDDDSLTSVPEWISNFRKLESLILPFNNIDTIPECLSDLKNLHKIILDDNNLKHVPNFIYKLPELLELTLSNNNFTDFRIAFSELKKLEVLNISDNKFDLECLQDIGLALSLKELDISRLNLKKIHASISKLLNLEVLNISYNKIDNIDCLETLISLQELYLYGSKLAELPRWIYDHPNLKFISFTDPVMNESYWANKYNV